MNTYRKSRNSMSLFRMRGVTLVAAVIVCLALRTTLLAAPIWDIFLDGDTPTTGSLLDIQPLVTPFGTITFDGEFFNPPSDPEFIAAGASGNVFDIDSSSTAQLSFDFDIVSATFIYGGNNGSILVEARDIHGTVVDSFFQANTYDGQPAGPVTLSGLGIRSLYWEDPRMNYAALDNIGIIVPEPTTIAFLGLGGLSLIRRRRKK
jgi:hypothetical protein